MGSKINGQKNTNGESFILMIEAEEWNGIFPVAGV
jgi:hypothetical protein